MPGNWKRQIPEHTIVRAVELWCGANGSDKDYDVVVLNKAAQNPASPYSVECFSGPAGQANNAQAKKAFATLRQANAEVDSIRRAKEKKGYQVIRDDTPVQNVPAPAPTAAATPSPAPSAKSPKKKKGKPLLNEMFKGTKPGVWF